ncbi:hypothetical protein BH24ACT22_BH24ACT22_21930 [soil metagenome]
MRFGVELATWNLHAAFKGKSLLEVLCASPVASVSVSGLLGGSAEEVLSGGGRMRAAGYEVVKLKVGSREVEEDVKLVRDLVEVLGKDVTLRLDTNRAWSYEEAADFVQALDSLGYEYIEEPLSDPSGLAGFVREHGSPVALDESLVGLASADLEKLSYARAMVIKPTMVGGISRTLQLAEEGRRLRIQPVISSAYETGVGTEALLVLSAVTGDGKVAAGLDTYRRLGGDVLYPPLDMTIPKIDARKVSGIHRSLNRRYLRVVASSES